MATTQTKTDNVDSIDDLIRAGMAAAEMLMTSLGEFAKLAVTTNPALKALQDLQGRRSCEIPPACWLPRSMGDIHSCACPGGTASIRIRVTNCQPKANHVEVVARSEREVKVTPESATIEPMERKSFSVCVSIPEDACPGEKFEMLVWVTGCNAYYLRWTVAAADRVSGSCHEVEIEDCPDYVHHWYDHFYCHRPCFHGIRKRTDTRA